MFSGLLLAILLMQSSLYSVSSSSKEKVTTPSIDQTTSSPTQTKNSDAPSEVQKNHKDHPDNELIALDQPIQKGQMLPKGGAMFRQEMQIRQLDTQQALPQQNPNQNPQHDQTYWQRYRDRHGSGPVIQNYYYVDPYGGYPQNAYPYGTYQYNRYGPPTQPTYIPPEQPPQPMQQNPGYWSDTELNQSNPGRY